LTETEACQLALVLLAQRGEAGGDPESAPVTLARARTIARESVGHPFFVYELVDHLQSAGPAATEESSSVRLLKLENALWAGAQRLPEGARRLLEVVAVAGRPLGRAEALRAAGLGPGDREAYAELHASRLVRGTGPSDVIEPYHDRIREVVTARLPRKT